MLEASHAAGLRVPEDIAIVGVDNDDIMCELTIPPLSSIEQGTRRIGFEAASILEAMMRRGAAATTDYGRRSRGIGCSSVDRCGGHRRR